jgi:hypothetical protein
MARGNYIVVCEEKREGKKRKKISVDKVFILK